LIQEKLREVIPWPVKSGEWKCVSEPAVEEFFRETLFKVADAEKVFAGMNIECRRWHTDRIPRMFGAMEDKALADLFKIVAQVAIKLRAEAVKNRERRK
jgi:hypothetical protein